MIKTLSDVGKLYQALGNYGTVQNGRIAYAIAVTRQRLERVLMAAQKAARMPDEMQRYEQGRIAILAERAKKDDSGAPVTNGKLFEFPNDEERQLAEAEVDSYVKGNAAMKDAMIEHAKMVEAMLQEPPGEDARVHALALEEALAANVFLARDLEVFLETGFVVETVAGFRSAGDDPRCQSSS